MHEQRIVIELGEETRVLIREIAAPRDGRIIKLLEKVLVNLREIKDMNAETVRLLGEIDAASTELAADIQALIDKANANGSATAEEINAALAPKVEFLKQLAADTNAPVPPVPPATDA